MASSSSSPFRIMDLPDELFIDILQLSFGNHPPPLLHRRRRKESKSVYWILGTPATYALVCRAWRRVIHESPRLWSSVTVNARHLRVGDTAVRVFVDWLTRAKSHPLSIELNLEAASPDHYKTLDLLLAFIEMLYSKYAWKLSITLPTNLWPQRDLSLRRLSAIFQNAPWLETFTLTIPQNGRSSAFFFSALDLVDKTPNLRRVTLATKSSTVHVLFPQTSLTKLVLGDYIHTLLEAFVILQNTPFLEIFQATIGCLGPTYAQSHLILLGRLRQLSIAFNHPHENDSEENRICYAMDKFFLIIRTPFLSELDLSAPRAPYRWVSIDEYLNKNFRPPIVKLVLSNIDIEGWRLHLALSLMSKLEVLTLIDMKCTNSILVALRVYRSPTVPYHHCPDLQALCIRIPKETEYDSEELVQMVFSRCRGYYKDLTVADGDTPLICSPKSIIITNIGVSEKEKLTTLIGHEGTGCSNYTSKVAGRNGNTLIINKKTP